MILQFFHSPLLTPVNSFSSYTFRSTCFLSFSFSWFDRLFFNLFVDLSISYNFLWYQRKHVWGFLHPESSIQRGDSMRVIVLYKVTKIYDSTELLPNRALPVLCHHTQISQGLTPKNQFKKRPLLTIPLLPLMEVQRHRDIVNHIADI